MGVEIKPASERSCTNTPALIFSIVLIATTIILVIVCGIIAPDVEEATDDCGFKCGVFNQGNFSCGNPDKRKFPKLIVTFWQDDTGLDIIHKSAKCSDSCPSDYIDHDNICLKDSQADEFFSEFNLEESHEITEALKFSWVFILVISFVAFVFSYIFLILFRHAAKYVIWVINIGFIVLVIGIAILGFAVGALEIGIGFSILGIIMVGLLFYFRRRIALVAKLFKETSVALCDTPGLIFEPIMTLISLLVGSAIFIVFLVIIFMTGDDQPIGTVAFYFNIVCYIWFVNFIIGCQNFVIAGTISKWYFTRDKTKLDGPIKTTFSHLLKFHLGSVCMGAILLTIAKIIKMLVNYIKQSAKEGKNPVLVIVAMLLMCIVDLLDQILQYLIRNAYVIIAKDGTPFIESGKRASQLLLDNITDVIALNHFGDIVLSVCRFLIVLIAGTVGYTAITSNEKIAEYYMFPLVAGVILAFLIAHCFVMVFEMTVDTIFICFCIDLDEHDGVNTEYYMSDGLKKILMEMKAEAGGSFRFGPKVPNEGENGISMYPSIPGPQDPMLPPQFPSGNYPNQPYPGAQLYPSAQPYPGAQPYPSQPYPSVPSYPGQQNVPQYPPQYYPAQPYPVNPYPQKH